jgi:hypothetical protein
MSKKTEIEKLKECIKKKDKDKDERLKKIENRWDNLLIAVYVTTIIILIICFVLGNFKLFFDLEFQTEYYDRVWSNYWGEWERWYSHTIHHWDVILSYVFTVLLQFAGLVYIIYWIIDKKL